MAAATTTAAVHNPLPHPPSNSISKLSSSFPLHFLRFTSNNSPFLHSSLSSSSSLISALTHLSTSSPPPPLHSDDEEYFEEEEQEEQEEEEEEESAVASAAVLLPSLPCPILTLKEKKELASYAHSLGKKLKSQQVGKSGVTPSVAASFVENLESNELLKIKVHGNCPMEFIDVVKQLEKATGSVAVAQIGRSMILYRPSISKMKKRESQGAKKIWKPKPRQPVAYPVVRRGQLSRSSQTLVRKGSRD